MRRKRPKSESRRTRRAHGTHPELTPAPGTHGIPLVVGLGNPGRGHRRDRHNVGFMVLSRLRDRSDILGESNWGDGRLALAMIGDRRFFILEPLTYMNLSGRAVSAVTGRYGVDPGDILLIHDDMDIPFGEVREKVGGGSAGHRGVESVIGEIGKKEFSRLRVGLGRPPEGADPTDFVLSRFSPDEERELPGILDHTCSLVLDFVQARSDIKDTN